MKLDLTQVENEENGTLSLVPSPVLELALHLVELIEVGPLIALSLSMDVHRGLKKLRNIFVYI